MPFEPLVDRVGKTWQKVLVIATGVLLCVTLSAVVNKAYAWGDRDRCHFVDSQTNRWNVFAGHHVDVYMAMCFTAGSKTAPPHLLWVRRPTLTFPSRSIVGAVENISVSQRPYVTRVGRFGKWPARVRYRFSVTQCVVLKGTLCNTFDFTARVGMLQTRLCFVGGACDKPKRW